MLKPHCATGRDRQAQRLSLLECTKVKLTAPPAAIGELKALTTLDLVECSTTGHDRRGSKRCT